MKTIAGWLVAVTLFAVVATANAGGYRYGASDQAFYVPAVALRIDPALFPRDRALIEPQMHLWLGDELLAAIAPAVGDDLPTLFGLLYLLTLVVLVAGGVALARSLGCDWWTIAAFLVLLTLRHRIAKTGANSLEGYMHPRMLAFAIGLFVLAAVVRGRLLRGAIWTLVAGLVHPTTAAWFGGVLAVAALWPHRRRRAVIGGVIAAAVAAVALPLALPGVFPRMDPAWLAVLGDKDYLFSADWPAYAWVTNLAYPVVLVAIYRRRRRLELTTTGESALLAGLLALVAAFLLSIPLTEAHVALAVQLQVNRVFWVLDVVVALDVAWWLATDVAGRWRPVARLALVGVLAALAVARGVYVLRVETTRSLVQFELPRTDWVEAMAWLRRQPTSWYVLADPGHAWKYGVSVRVAARRDTLLESGKDTAFALYDRETAMRVADRQAALADFDDLSRSDVRALGARYGLDVFVDRADRSFDLPVLHRNAGFVIYDLR